MHELFNTAIELTRLYVLRCIDEESLTVRDTQEERINRLKDFTTDVKSSDRFLHVETTRELVEVYSSVVITDFDKQFIHGGASFLLMSLGKDNFNKLTAHLAETIHMGNSGPGDSANKDPISYGGALRSSPWLVFCVLCRFTWFSQVQPQPQQGS